MERRKYGKKTKTINDAVKVWKDKHLRLLKLNATERKIYERNYEGMRSTYGKCLR